MRHARLAAMLGVVWVLGTLAGFSQQPAGKPAGTPPPVQAAEKPADAAAKNLIVGETPRPAPEAVRDGFNSISEKAVEAFIRFLSADSMEGRVSASTGYDTAAEFIAAQLALSGAGPAGDAAATPLGAAGRVAGAGTTRSYFQEIPIKEVIGTGGQIVASSAGDSMTRSRTFFPDVDYQPGPVMRQESLRAPVVFAGYGIREPSANWDDYAGLDVKGRVVMVLSEAPGWNDPQSSFGTREMHEKYGPRRSMRHALPAKAVTARDLGAVALLMVENSPGTQPDVPARILEAGRKDDSKPILDASAPRMNLAEPSAPMRWETLPVIRISREMADSILELSGQRLGALQEKINGEMKPQSRSLDRVSLSLETTVQYRLTRSRNVLGFLEGSDPELKGDAVILGAHLDHLGRRGEYVFNGADDNGSGCAALLEIARAFAANRERPKRSVIFAFWMGEEEGLLGSRYYAEHPFLPLGRTVACLNLDMIGRTWTAERLKRTATQWGVALPEGELSRIQADRFLVLPISEDASVSHAIRESAPHVGLSLFLRPSRGGAGGSDHAPFATRGIPWVFFFGSMHDDYHGPADTIDNVSLQQVADVARLAYLAAFRLADR